MSIISEYEQVLIGNIPEISEKNFIFKEGLNERIALKIFKYAIEKLLRWSPKQAEASFSPETVRIMKLESLLKYIQFPPEISEKNTEYIVHLLYPREVPFQFRRYVIDIYEKVLNNEMKYPKDYMYGSKGLTRAVICLQYSLNKNKIFHSIDDMYRFFASSEGMKYLKEKKLYQLYTSFYHTPLEYLHNSLPFDMRDDLLFHYYRFQFRFKQKNRSFPIWAEECL